MGPIARRFVTDILTSTDPDCILHVQEGVCVFATYDKKVFHADFTGQLILVRKPESVAYDVSGAAPEHENKTAGSTSSLASLSQEENAMNRNTPTSDPEGKYEYFLLWAPDSFLQCFTGVLGKESLKLSSNNTGVTVEPREWRYTTFVEIKSIARIRRGILPLGVHFIELCFLNGEEGHPLAFKKGGVTKFLDAFKKIAPVKQSAFQKKEFIVYGEETAEVWTPDANRNNTHANKNTSDAALEADDKSAAHEQLKRNSPHGAIPLNSDASARRPEDDVHNLVYGPASPSGVSSLSAAIASKLRSFPLQLPSNRKEYHGRGAAGVYSSTSASETVTGDSPVQEPFELIEEPIPIEHLMPSIPPCENRTMGPPLTEEDWRRCFVAEEGGRLDPHQYARAMEIAHFGGIEKKIRLEVWCFMLSIYPNMFKTTEAQRQFVRDSYHCMYMRLTDQWRSIFPEQESRFTAFREMRTSIEKDVVRTDRLHEAYAADAGVKQQMLQRVLMAHGMFNFDLGYCQGMSDMLSPIALLSSTETDAFMCFSAFLSERCEGNFRKDVKKGMNKKLEALRMLVQFFIPDLYKHLQRESADDMTFCFRWLMMLFKREFSLEDTMLLWDVIISCPYTPQFEFFVTAALLKGLTPQILDHQLTHDELLKFTNSIAFRVNVKDVILLAQEFYDDVTKKAMAMESKEISVKNCRPLLNDILSLIKSPEM